MKLRRVKTNAVLCPKFGHYVLKWMCGRGCGCLNYKESVGGSNFVSCSFTLTDAEREEMWIINRNEVVLKEQEWMLHD